MTAESSSSPRPVAIVADGHFYVGPELCRHLATRGFNLVVGNGSDELAAELQGLGAVVEVVPNVQDLADPKNSDLLVERALITFGRIDSAVMFSGQIVTGRFVNSSLEDLRLVVLKPRTTS